MRAPKKGATHPDLDVEDELAAPPTSSASVAPSQIEQLPALIDRATRCLAEARTSAEVLEAKAAAEAALHYAKITKAANETQADCLRMIVRAEMRMADEIDRGQAAGEVARQDRHPGSVRAVDTEPITYESLGIDRRRVPEWREIRDAGDQVVEQAINGALAEGRAPTKADIRYTFRTAFTGKCEWYTPVEHIALARQVLGEIDLDPASCEFAQGRVRARRYYTIEDDGLAQPWEGRIWCNPPYSQPEVVQFVEKLVASVRSGTVTEAIMLTNNYTDTAWFHHAESACAAICFTRGRIRFEDETSVVSAPVNGHAFFYYGPQSARFREIFSTIGFVR
jgi:phage N-6-adenine-methyltransferase